MLGAALVFGALGLFAKGFLRPKAIASDAVPMTTQLYAAVVIGLFGGFIVGLTSVGSGTFFGLTMLILFPLGAQTMGITFSMPPPSLYVAAPTSAASNVDLGVVGWLLLGSIPGVLLGSQWSIRLPEAVLRRTLGTVLLLSGVKLVAPAGASAGIAVAVGIGLAALFTYGLVSRADPQPRRSRQPVPRLQ